MTTLPDRSRMIALRTLAAVGIVLHITAGPPVSSRAPASMETTVTITPPASGVTSGTKRSYTYSVTVSNYQPGGKEFCDFHVYPRAGATLSFQHPTTKPAGWKVKKAANGGLAFVAADHHCLTSGTHNFVITTAASPTPNEPVMDLVATSTRLATRSEDDELGTAEGIGPARNLDISGSNDLENPGTWTGLGYALELSGKSTFTIKLVPNSAYEVYIGGSNRDDWEDPDHLGINRDDALLDTMGVTATGLTGRTDANGEAQFTLDGNGEVKTGDSIFIVAVAKTSGGDRICQTPEAKLVFTN